MQQLNNSDQMVRENLQGAREFDRRAYHVKSSPLPWAILGIVLLISVIILIGIMLANPAPIHLP